MNHLWHEPGQHFDQIHTALILHFGYIFHRNGINQKKAQNGAQTLGLGKAQQRQPGRNNPIRPGCVNQIIHRRLPSRQTLDQVCVHKYRFASRLQLGHNPRHGIQISKQHKYHPARTVQTPLQPRLVLYSCHNGAVPQRIFQKSHTVPPCTVLAFSPSHCTCFFPASQPGTIGYCFRR